MNYFVPLDHKNLYYLLIVNPTEYCKDKPPKSYELNKSGKKTLDSGCKVCTENICIRSRTNYRMNSQANITITTYTKNTLNVFINKIDFAQNITLPVL